MPDFGSILQNAQEQAKSGGYGGYSGYDLKKAIVSSGLADALAVTTAITPLVTVVTKSTSGGVSVEGVTSVTTAELYMVTPAAFKKRQRLQQLKPNVTTVTTENHDFGENSAVRLADLRNSMTIYEPQADPNRCHVCGERETAEALFIAVLTSRPGSHHWLHAGSCHDEHMRRCAEGRSA